MLLPFQVSNSGKGAGQRWKTGEILYGSGGREQDSLQSPIAVMASQLVHPGIDDGRPGRDPYSWSHIPEKERSEDKLSSAEQDSLQSLEKEKDVKNCRQDSLTRHSPDSSDGQTVA